MWWPDNVDPDAVAAAADALSRSDFAAAVAACKSDRGELVNEAGLMREIDFILTRTPRALADCPENILTPVRIATAVMVLWGQPSRIIQTLVSVEGNYNYRHEPETIALMLSSFATRLSDLARMAEVGVKKVKVISSGHGDDCAVCKLDDRKIYDIANAPEIPHPDCVCKHGYGCRCTLVPSE